MQRVIPGVVLAIMITAGTVRADGGAASPAVDAVLTALERAGAQVQTVQCAVRYTVDDKLNLAQSTKVGTVRFRKAQPHPLFLVHFEKTLADGLILGRAGEWWLFRDGWLWEAKGKGKTIIKREMVRPGEKVDFFDLDRSRLPMPFGQRKGEILENFTVSLIPPRQGDPPKTDHLRCIPKAEASLAREFSRVDYYVSQRLHLPVRIDTVDAENNKATRAEFPDLSSGNINVEITDNQFTLPKSTKDFHQSVEPLPK